MRLFNALGKTRYYRSHGVTITDVSGGSWTKSSFSSMNGNCVEISRLTVDRIGVRDTKDGDSGPVLFFTSAEWSAFLAGAREGQFDSL
jgi:hypothetical protein